MTAPYDFSNNLGKEKLNRQKATIESIKKTKEIAKDIATIDFSKELVQLIYNSIVKNQIASINQ